MITEQQLLKRNVWWPKIICDVIYKQRKVIFKIYSAFDDPSAPCLFSVRIVLHVKKNKRKK